MQTWGCNKMMWGCHCVTLGWVTAPSYCIDLDQIHPFRNTTQQHLLCCYGKSAILRQRSQEEFYQEVKGFFWVPSLLYQSFLLGLIYPSPLTLGPGMMQPCTSPLKRPVPRATLLCYVFWVQEAFLDVRSMWQPEVQQPQLGCGRMVVTW